MRIRIGVSDVSRELEAEVDDAAAFETLLEDSFASGKHVLWFTDATGKRYAVPTAKLAYVEVESAGQRVSVGFSAQ